MEVTNGQVITNPIAGTELKPQRIEDFREVALRFVRNLKEIYELGMMVDEIEKFLEEFCPDFGQLLGPFLIESGSVIHTMYEYISELKNPEDMYRLIEKFVQPTVS